MKNFEVLTLELVTVPAATPVRDGTSFLRWLGLGPVRVGEAGRLPGVLPRNERDDDALSPSPDTTRR